MLPSNFLVHEKFRAHEQTISKYIRKWLGLHHSTSSLSFHLNSSPCRLPGKSFVEVYMSAKVSQYLLLRDSKDPVIQAHTPSIPTGHSWDVSTAVSQAETELDFRCRFGTSNLSRAGLGLQKRAPVIPPKGTQEYRQTISQIVCEFEQERRYASAVQLEVQGSWTQWLDYVQTNLSWASARSIPPRLLTFHLASSFQSLPSPSNLSICGLGESSQCGLCNQRGTVRHVLSACPAALNGGRFTMRHDKVLLALYEFLVNETKKLKFSPSPAPSQSRVCHDGGGAWGGAPPHRADFRVFPLIREAKNSHFWHFLEGKFL